MNKRDLLSVACKIIGLILLMQALIAIPSFFIQSLVLSSKAYLGDKATPFVMYVAPIIMVTLYIVIGLIFLFRSEAISRSLIKEDDLLIHDFSSASERSLVSLGTRLIGLYILSDSIPGMVINFVRVPIAVAGIFNTTRLEVMQSAFTSLIAIYFLFGAPQLIKFLYRTKQSTPIESSEDQSQPS